ncbi:MAG: hypothetical protein M3Q07_17450, partial [Pseudobdellovibrionaceae bacterium]|nr:hypothetical protein [Pseudobdellovibrionaceae bacterium]
MAINKLSDESLKQAMVNAERTSGESHEADLLNEMEIRQDSQQLKAEVQGAIHEEKNDSERDVLTNVTGGSLAADKANESALPLSNNGFERSSVSFEMKGSDVASSGPLSGGNTQVSSASTGPVRYNA